MTMTEAEHGLAEMDGTLTLSRDIRRACQLLEKLQKSKYCGEVRPVQCCSAAVLQCEPCCRSPPPSWPRCRRCCSLSS